jgi:hypothetical protein
MSSRSLPLPHRSFLLLLLLFIVCCSAPGSSGGGSPSRAIPSKPPPSGGEAACPAYDAAQLPPAPTPVYVPSAGTIPGSFSVSASGQANYTFPLVVPPGRLGMEPTTSDA